MGVLGIELPMRCSGIRVGSSGTLFGLLQGVGALVSFAQTVNAEEDEQNQQKQTCDRTPHDA